MSECRQSPQETAGFSQYDGHVPNLGWKSQKATVTLIRNSGFFHIELLYIVERDEIFDSVLRIGQRKIVVFGESLRNLKKIVHIFGF